MTPSSPADPLDKYFKHLTAVSDPLLPLLVLAVVLGFFSLLIDPWLQQIAPVETWPPIAKGLHWVSPWLAASTALTAAALLLGGLDGVWLRYFTHRTTVINLLVLALIVVVLTGWAAVPLAVQLAARQ